MQITLTFNEQLNSSLQIGDTVWYLNTNQAGGYDTAKSSLAKIPDLDDVFIMFSKDNRANTSSLVGYYAEVSLENHSKEKIELFAVNSEIAQSSK